MSKFKGFNQDQILNPRQTSQNPDLHSEGSEYDSTVESRETTPTNSPPRVVDTVKRNRQATKGSVRQLVEQFSHSDSDSAEGTTSSIRRRRSSRTTDLIELPLGGERQLRKNMADQVKANEAIALWKAMSGLLTKTMDEADQAISDNLSKEALTGQSAAIVTSEADSQEAWEEVEHFKSNTNVELNYITLLVAKKKEKTRSSKIRGHIAALTVQPAVSESTVVRVVQPTSFGNLKLPDYSGDYTEFDGFYSHWTALIENGNLDEGGKKAHLLLSLKGDAKAYIGTDSLAHKSYEEIWSDLRNRYGKPWRVTRAAVKKVMDIQDPSEGPKDISRYWNELMEACKIAERLKLTASGVILNMGLLKLPVDFRAKMDEKLKLVSADYILTRDLVSEPFNDIIAGEIERPNSIMATIGFNTAVQPVSDQQGAAQRKRPSNRTGKQVFHCLLCGKDKAPHKTWQCTTFRTGVANQNRMRGLNRCQHCAVPLNEHGNDCSHRSKCRQHPTQRHNFWLCPNFDNTRTTSQYPQQQQPRQQVQQQYPQAQGQQFQMPLHPQQHNFQGNYQQQYGYPPPMPPQQPR